MANNQHRPTGFTLVEILIVVCILGILAAIVVPRFSNASLSASANSATAQLSTLRKMLEVYRADHSGAYPTLVQVQLGTTDWDVLTNKTDITGNVSAAGKFGPYLTSSPANSFTNSTLVVAAGAPVTTSGWTYDQNTGALKMVIPGKVDPTVLGLLTTDYEIVTAGH